MRKLFYVGLEPYNERYTLQLTEWMTRALDRRGVDYTIVPGTTLNNNGKIAVGQVLDAHGRSYFALSQTMHLVNAMHNGDCTGDDAIFFEDMFHPGIESLPYIMNQVSEDMRPEVYVRCLAQSIDPDDFIHVHGMEKWMGKYEKMVCEFATVLASSEEMVANMKIAGWDAPIYNISGLTFDADEVRERVPEIIPFDKRRRRVAFTARFDQEKQPDFFMDIVEKMAETGVEFAIFSGAELRSNNPRFVERARALNDSGALSIYENLSKNQYYNLLSDTRVVFNCALQDWFSNTISEADALGTNVVYPAYRSFPEALANDADRLYIPWSQDDAIKKIHLNLKRESPNMGAVSKWTSHTADRIIDIMQFRGEKWARYGNRYRDLVAPAKY